MKPTHILAHLLFLVIFGSISSLYAQIPLSGTPEFTAPDAWSFMKYGGQTPNLYTGTVSVGIPIYTYKDRDFEVPVSLGYASNGFIPNSSSGSLGLGWFLNAGGYITREVVGLPDEDNYRYYDSYLKGYYAYFMHANKPALSSPIMSRGGWNNYEQRFLFHSDPSTPDPSLIRPHWESESDIFTFNFMGHSGKFVMSDSGVWVFNSSHPQGEYKIDMSQFSADYRTNPKGHGASKITITTGDGYTYIFSGFPLSELKTNDKQLDQMEISKGYDKESTPYVQKTWKLIRIEAPNGRRVEFEYSVPDYVESTKFGGQLYKVTKLWHSKGRFQSSIGQFIDDNQLDRNSYFNVKKYGIASNWLNKIIIDNKCEISFAYTDRSKKEVWKNLYILGDTTIGSVIHFNVPRKENLKGGQQLYKITVNSLIAPSQILKECNITYGYPNAEGNNILLLKEVAIAGEGSYKMNYNNEQDKFPYQGSPSFDHWGYYNLYVNHDMEMRPPNPVNFVVPDVYVNQNTYVETHNIQNKTPNAAGAKYGMLSKLSYPTGGYTTYEYEPHTYSKRVYRDYASQNIPALRSCSEADAGGVRIKKIIDYTAESQIAFSREYVYRSAIASNAGSSGNLLHMPRYWLQVGKMASKSDQNYYYELTSTLSITDLMAFSMTRTHIEYGKVYEKFNDGSYIAYGFSNFETIPDRFDTSSSQLSASSYEMIPWTMIEPEYAENFLRYPHSMSSQRGKPTFKEYYNSDGDIQKKDAYVYDTGKNLRFQESVKSTVQQGTIYYVHKTLTDDYPLLKTHEASYFGANSVINETKYDYNALGQLTCTETTNSAGDSIRRQTQYINDSPTEPGRDGFITGNYYGLPIRTQTKIKRNGSTDFKLAAGSYFNYALATAGTGTIPVLNYTQATDIANPVTCPDFGFNSYLTTGETYSYDTNGNIKEITDKNGIKRTYLWGYMNMYPIAKIENASYSEVAAILGSNITSIGNASVLSDTHIVLLNSLRRSLPNAIITIYTYKPLIGISSIIDPSERKIVYKYDDQGRLECVEDDKGNLLNEYEYHFAE